MQGKTRLIVDDTTIYEVDMECYSCMPEEERKQYYGNTLRKKLEEQEKGTVS